MRRTSRAGWQLPGKKRLLIVSGTSFVLVLLGCLLLSGCISIVTPPPHPSDPVTVYLVNEAMHKGILFPRANGTFVEYGFGDWDWYALGYDSWYHAFDTVLWPTQGTLGRRLAPVRDAASLRNFYSGVVLDPLIVEKADATALLEELDQAYDRNVETSHYNPQYRTHFVEHDDGYWFLYNCNDAAADWLRKLGCSVSFVLIRLGLSASPPEEGM